MAHIPKDDIEQLWKQAPHNWHGLHQALEQRRGKAQGIDNDLVKRMIHISHEMEQSGQSFPDNCDALYHLLNQKIGAGSSS